MNESKPMNIHYDIKGFQKHFEKIGKYCAVEDWSYSKDSVNGYWIVIVLFANKRKVRFQSDGLKCLYLITDMIDKNKAKHNS